MLTGKYDRHRRGIARTITVSLIIFAVAFLATLTIFFVAVKAPTTLNHSVKSDKHEPKPKQISSNVLFLGNTYWGRYINDWSMASPLKYQYPFSRLNEFHRDKYDAWISGIECPVVAGIHVNSAQEDATLQFNCSPDYLPEAAKWYTAFTLANNHTDNQGADGFNETREQLDKNHIQYFGHYDPTVIDDVCEVLSLPVTVTNDDNKTDKGMLPVAMCGFHGVFRIPPADSVEQMMKYSAYMPVIALPHMGAEYKPEPDQIKTDFYRSLIDGGADMVIGDHPHWVQSTEGYKGHLIVYSMGNFMFDQQDSVEVTRSAGINVVLKTADTDKSLLQKWLNIGGQCSSFKDDCLEKIKSQGLTKLHINYQFDVVSTNDGDKIVKPATVDQRTSVLNRLNWQTTMNQLKAPYSRL